MHDFKISMIFYFFAFWLSINLNLETEIKGTINKKYIYCIFSNLSIYTDVCPLCLCQLIYVLMFKI